ncbi:MAG TPA: methyltransferase domain-containing protein [Egibacteraceae bacterium]|nr:methyltransferase domain-containing protein [Actinomycetota bacterium]HWB71376.1 methyltransferase domain-containing protein [Egibacteraceae bacterium]
MAQGMHSELPSYRHWAGVYDLLSGVTAPLRRRAVDRLGLGRGDVVLDVGCGTGLSFPLIRERVGSEGRIIGIDLSAAMLAQARARAERHGWSNVTLIRAAVEKAPVPARADAALFCLVHDVLRCRVCLEHVVGHLAPSARVAAAGAKWGPWWAPPVNLAVWALNRPYVTAFEGFGRPWDHLGGLLPDLRVEELPSYLHGAFVAWGTPGGR